MPDIRIIDSTIFPVRFAATSTEISFAKSVLKKLATLSASAFIESTILQFSIILFILLLVPALNLSGITLSRMRRRMAELGVRRAFGATQGTILWQVLSENMVLTLLGGLLGLAMSYGAMLLLRDWLLVTSLGKTGLSTGMFNGAVFIAAFLFCLVLNLFSAGLPAWRMSRLNITDSING